jgi:hypothetical protein
MRLATVKHLASARRLSTVKRFAMICAASAAVAVMGCDDSHSADRRVRETLQQVRLERLKGPDGVKTAQDLLTKAAQEASASAPTRAHAKALLARAELDAAEQLINDTTSGIDARNRDVARLIFEINQLGEQIGATNTYVGVYRQFEPKEARAAAQQKLAEATGGADAKPWIAGPVPIPSLTDVKKQIQALEQQVAQQEDQIKKLQQQRQQIAQSADQAFRDAETKKGKENLEAYTRASGLRKQSADLANQIEVAQAKLAPVKQDLAIAQAREQAVQGAVELFQKMAAEFEQGWKNVQASITKQQQNAAEILNGGGDAPATSFSIAKKSAELSKAIDGLKEAYDAAEKNLADSSKHYEDAATAAEELSRDYHTKSAALPRDNPMRVAMDTLVQVYNSSVFKLGQANATLALADLQGRRAESLAEQRKMVEALRPVLEAAGLKMPAALDDASLAQQLKSVSASSDENYAAATDLYGTVSEAPGASEAEKNAGKIGRIFALYGRSLLARASGGNAQNAAAYFNQAKEFRDAALADKVNSPALPAALVIAPAAPTTNPAGSTSAPAGT